MNSQLFRILAFTGNVFWVAGVLVILWQLIRWQVSHAKRLRVLEAKTGWLILEEVSGKIVIRGQIETDPIRRCVSADAREDLQQ